MYVYLKKKFHYQKRQNCIYILSKIDFQTAYQEHVWKKKFYSMVVASKNKYFLCPFPKGFIFYISPYLNLTLADNLLHHCILLSITCKLNHHYDQKCHIISQIISLWFWLAVVDLVVFTIYKRTLVSFWVSKYQFIIWNQFHEKFWEIDNTKNFVKWISRKISWNWFHDIF